jgi:hypothetical protein
MQQAFFNVQRNFISIFENSKSPTVGSFGRNVQPPVACALGISI